MKLLSEQIISLLDSYVAIHEQVKFSQKYVSSVTAIEHD